MRYAALAILMLLTGCAGDASAPPLAADHPANPAAPTAPLQHSTTVALGEAATATASPTTAPAAPPPVTTKPTSGAVYVCPMHEEVTSNDSNARCPICTMRLVLKKGGAR